LLIGEDVVGETRAFNAALEELLARQPSLHTLAPATIRRARREGRGVFPPLVFLDHARTLTVPGRDREIPVRIFEPQDPRGAYLHLHGGGWTIGSSDGQDEWLWEIAQATSLTVVSVEYRLAPEQPFPAGPDDAEDAARWFLERYDGRLTIGGESAGAQLAVLALLRLRDSGVSRFDAANLVFGAFDLTGTPSRRLWGERNLILSSPVMDWFADCFLPGVPVEERQAPEVSPLFADLHGLPPALFTCGTLDPLLDDSLFMDARWRAAGNGAELALYAEGIHGFTAFPLELARRARAAQIAFLRG
jgi:acetyl esterase/lipase